MDDLRSLLIEHEGLKLFPYTDTVGKTTIGVGRNLTDRGISHNEAMTMMNNDIGMCINQLEHFSWYTAMDKVRQEVLVELCFNIGLPDLLKFKTMISFLIEKDWELAADAMLASKWRQDVGVIRSSNMAKRLVTGSYA